MIDREIKRVLGQMAEGVQVVAATHDGVVRAYTSHWVSQVSFAEPIVLASVSPAHDTHPLIVASGAFTTSILAGDQVAEGQYFSYPGRRFHRVATEYLDASGPYPFVPGCIGWFHAEVIDTIAGRYDHDLFFARVTEVGVGRTDQPHLVYSSRQGWRIADTRARERGDSVRDRLLARLAEAEGDGDAGDDGGLGNDPDAAP
ncbi:MAG: flavin reductase [Acidimicrobiales bacterium]|nr:flavin reductase [Acidimicrobiales bacterium]